MLAMKTKFSIFHRGKQLELQEESRAAVGVSVCFGATVVFPCEKIHNLSLRNEKQEEGKME